MTKYSVLLSLLVAALVAFHATAFAPRPTVRKSVLLPLLHFVLPVVVVVVVVDP